MQSNTRTVRGCARIVAIVAALSAANVWAVTHTWNGGNSFGPDSMANSLNWSGGTPVSANSNLTLIFPTGASSLIPNQNIANPLVLQSMQITGSNYTFGGSSYSFQNLGAAPTMTNSGFNTISNALQFAAPTTITGAANTNLSLNGTMTGSQVTFSATGAAPSFQIGGSGTNTISAVITNDTAVVANKGASIASSLQLNGGTLRVTAPGGLANNTAITINPTTLSPSFGELEFYFAGSTLGPTTINNARLAVIATTVTLNSNLTATGTSYIPGAASSNQPYIDLNGANRTISTPAAGDSLTVGMTSFLNGTWTKVGAGTMSLNSSLSTYTGQNVISAGKVVVGSEQALGTNTLNNATLEVTGGSYTGLISGTGNVIINGFAQYSALNSYSGGTSLTAGSTLAADPQYVHGAITGAANTSILFNVPTNQTMNATLSGPILLQFQNSGVATINAAQSISGDINLFFNAGGGLKLGASNALGTGPIMVASPSNQTSFESTGNVVLPNTLLPFTGLSFVGGGNLAFTSTNAKGTNFPIVHNSTGSTSMAGKFSLGATGSITVNAGNLKLGDAASVGGFTAAGPITVNAGGTLTLQSLNFISLPDVTLAGGTLSTPNGYAIPLGAALQGDGTVLGRVSSANGSTIIASGNLTLGDNTHVAGVNLDGELYTNKFVVQLEDANQSVLGSLTNLGSGPGAPGTLVSMSGAVVNFGRNITGNGLIKSTNALAQAVIMNGDVNGDSPTDYIEFSGYVKGVGTFNNVAFSGTFSPGLSPALLTVGNVTFTPSNVLDIEIGGLNRGGQYDALDVTGLLNLNGQLKVTLINAWNPALGDIYNLIDGPTAGTFSSFFLPPLNVGLVWDTSYLYSLGELRIAAVPEPTTLCALGLAASVGLKRRRRTTR
ncbi:MAG: PEP-CTERM sorting domain-containing protein [Tepidisphaeraceae bacterium]